MSPTTSGSTFQRYPHKRRSREPRRLSTWGFGAADRCGLVWSVQTEHCGQGLVDAPLFLGAQVAAEFAEP